MAIIFMDGFDNYGTEPQRIMPRVARIMPAQRLDQMRDVTHTRFGFVIPNHPMGAKIEYPLQFGYQNGDYVASWATREIAEMAACSLGMPLSVVQPVTILLPECGLHLTGDE